MTAQTPLIIVGIYLRGDSLDPKSVTAELGIEPDSSQKKGDVHITSTNHEVTAKIGMWELLAKSNAETVSPHIEEILGKFEGRAKSLREMAGVEEAYIDIFIACNADDSCKLSLTRLQLDRFSHLDLDLRITLSGGPD